MQMERKQFKVMFKKWLYRFTLKLIEFLDSLPTDNTSRRLSDQLLRSGTSILANYVEGQSSSSKREFTNYLNYSLKSANESKVWLALLRDSKRVKSENAAWYLKELDELSRILASSLMKLKGKK